MTTRLYLLATLLATTLNLSAQTETTAPCGPVPNANQLRWQEMEMYAFIHYSLNTYTDQEWGFGNESPSLFNPSDLDCRQWARVCKQAGMKGIIFTAKHHCGFCMWPSAYTEYSVKNSPWKNGQGDVVRELADACHEEGLEFAVYLSPWDRNHPDYGKKEYVTYFRNQLRELLTNYGEIFEVWFDGANGGDGWYGGANETRQIDRTTYYEWPETYKMIRELQPKCLIWNDGSDRGDLRWVGTEAGNIGETNWSLLNHDGEVTWPMLHYGLEDGDSWVPGETNTSIRPGWFYHDTENEHVKSLSKLMDTYYKSVGRNSCLLLNFPIAPNGRIHPNDSLRGIAFNQMIHEVFKTDLTKKATVTTSQTPHSSLFTYHFQEPTAFNRFVAEEDIALGQRVKKFSLEAEIDGQWQPLKDALVENGDGLTTIGHRRIVCFPTVTATKLRFTILDAKCQPIIKKVGVYLAPELTPDIPNSGEKLSSNLHIFFSAPNQMIIDYDTEQTITAFRYLPPQTGTDGTVTHYSLYASSDWTNWTKLASGEFSNIVNNPIWQTVKFAPTKARILRFEADKLASGERMGYGVVEVKVMPATAQDKIYANEFPLGDVTLLDGPLKRARDLNIRTLLQYDCDRLLAPYRKEAGLEPKANTYPNWDGLDGHVGGHYLTAMAINAATGSEECRQRMEYMISELQTCADANVKKHPDWGRGYVGSMPNSEAIWSNFKKGDFGVYFGSWAPFYNLHKMYAGLRDAWLYCGNAQAKALFLGFCDWAIDLTAGLSDEQMERMLDNEHGGMNEVLADAYAITGEQKYLDCAKRFSHRRLLTPMSQRQDCLDNMHANTQVPKVVGFERIAELSGDEPYHTAAAFFWDIVTGERSLAFGGDSRREHFPSKEACKDFINDIDGPESCNTNNMLKLTEDLHRRNPEARYADFFELATFNHILSTQHPEHGGYVYFTPARPRHYRNYSAPNEAMWCCVGTGMENHGKYGQFIYTHVGRALYVNLFVASELNWREQGIRLRQETQFPYGETSRITITEGKGQFPLLVRYPGWVSPGQFSVKVNGQPVELISGPSSYVAIERQWKKGDVVEVSFPMHNSIKYLPNVPQYIALMHGPILLGMKTGTEDLAHLVADDSRFGQYASGKKLPINEAPILINNHIEDIASQLQPVEGKPLHFTLSTKMENAIHNEIQPFFEIHDARYMVYWLALSEQNYKGYLDQLAKAEEERQALEARTIDKVQPGEQQPETDHKMETDNSYTGNTNDVFWRDANDGHYFSYLMQTGGHTDLSLRLKYWGVGEWKSHEFDIFVDDVLVQSVNNTGKYRISEFKYETYPLPTDLLKGKSQVRIKFVAKPHRQIGEIYGVRLVK